MRIHGHEVIQMMQTSGKYYSRATLVAEITAKFGRDTRFFTCSADNLTPEQLIDFLAAKGKFSQSEEGFKFRSEEFCDHE